MYSIGVDVGGSHIAACVYDHEARALQRETLVYRKVNTRSLRDVILGEWMEAIRDCRDKANVEIHGAGIAMPGPFDYYGGVSHIRNVGKLEELYGVNVRYALAEKLGLAPSDIRFINDATAFSIAEAMVGRASAYRRAVAITLGTGFGSSFLIEGKPVITGSEVPDGGFLYNQPCGEQLADDLFSTRGIKARYKMLSGNEVADVKTLCEEVFRDPHAQRTFESFGKELGAFLRPYLNTFSAEVVAVGGNISKAFPYFGAALKKELPDVDVYVSRLGEEAAMIGGALLMDDAYYHFITDTLKLMSAS